MKNIPIPALLAKTMIFNRGATVVWLGVGLACSSEPGMLSYADSDYSDEQRATVVDDPSPEEIEADFRRRVTSPLSADERTRIERALLERNIPLDEITFVGRMLVRYDTYFDVDDLLWIDSEVAKGRVQADNVDPYARLAGGATQFRRPFVTDVVGGAVRNIYVVPNSPSFLLTAFIAATQNIRDAANDCLNANNLSTMNRTSWDQLGSQGQSTIPRSFIVYGNQETACPGLTSDGCGFVPTTRSIITLGSQANRMQIGARIGIRNDITAANTVGIGVVMHEIMHTLGVAHPFAEPVTKLTIPGTNSALPSIMNGCSAVGTCTLTAEDVDIIDTLYSPPPGGTCAHNNNFVTITAN